MKRYLLILTALLGIAFPAAADMNVSGTIAADATWTAAAGPYHVTGSLTVDSGAILTVEAGVTVLFEPGANIEIKHGALRTLGTSSSRVTFTSSRDISGGIPAPGDWGELRFLDAANDVVTRLDYTTVRYGKGVVLQGASPAFFNCSIENNQGNAMTIDLASFPSGDGNHASGNTLNGILVPAGDMTQSGGWTLKGIPFVLAGSLSVGQSPSLSGINPVEVQQGDTVNAIVTGARLSGADLVTFSGIGLTGTIQAGGTDTTTPVRIVVAEDAPAGARSFSLRVAAGTIASASNAITVKPAVPHIASMTPASMIVNQPAVTLSIDGAHLTADSTVTLDGASLSTTFIDSTHLTAIIPSQSSVGSRTIQISKPDPLNPGAFLLSNTITLPVSAPYFTFSPISAHIVAGRTVNLRLSAPYTAPAGGIMATLVSTVPLVATVPASATIPEGADGIDVVVTGAGAGNAQIVANRSGWTSGTLSVAVDPPPYIDIAPASTVLGVGRSATFTVTSSEAAPAGGLAVNLSDSAPGIVSHNAAVTIPEGGNSASFTTTGATAGDVQLSGTSGIFVSRNRASITVRPLGIVLPGSILVSPGLFRDIAVLLTDPAPAGGLTVNFGSGNATVATVAASITIPEGGTSGTVRVTGVASGNTTVTASDPNGAYNSGACTVNVASTNISFTPNTATFFAGMSYSGSRIFISNAAPSGGQVINLSSSNTSIATVPAMVTIPEGQTSVAFTVTGVGAGNATITSGAQGLNSGTFTANVAANSLNLNTGEFTTLTGVRYGAYRVSIAAGAPNGGVAVKIKSDDPAVALVAPYNTTTVPAQEMTLTIPSGGTYVDFDVIGASTAGITRFNGPIQIGRDGSGNLYVVDHSNHRIRKVNASTGMISTIAGTGSAGFNGDGGLATSAQLNYPYGVAVDGDGNVYIADHSNHRIRKIDAVTGNISTFAGDGTAGFSGDGGQASAARINGPIDLEVHGGALYIADYYNRRVRRVDLATGVINTVAGTTSAGYNGDNQAATSAQLYNPHGIGLDASGNLYIADHSNARVRKVTAGADGLVNGSADDLITTIAGNGSSGFSGDGGLATSSQINGPLDVATDSAGNVYITDYYNQRVRKIEASSGNISTYAGNGSAGYSGDGMAATGSRLYYPRGLVVDGSANIYIADYSNQRVRRVDAATRQISTVAGTGTAGFDGDGTPATGYRVRATASGFTGADAPVRVGQSRLYLHGLETSRNTLSPDNSFYVSAGDDSWLGSGQRLAQEVQVNIASSNPSVETVTTPLKIGNNQGYSVYHGDSAVRYSNAHVTGTGSTTVSAGIDGSTPAAINGTSAGVTIVPATMSVNSGNTMTTLTGVRYGAYAVYLSGPAPAGGVSVTLASDDPAVVLLAPYNSTTSGTGSLTLTIPQGSSTSPYFDVIGAGTAADIVRLNGPLRTARDGSGNLYFTDHSNQRVRKVDAATGKISTVAGTGSAGYSGDGGPATSAQLYYPFGIAVDGSGNVYIADRDNHRVRRVDATTGNISTVAGNGTAGYSGDGGAATSARLYSPVGLTFDGGGNLLIADYNNHRIRKVDTATGNISTVAGNGSAGYLGDGGPAASARLYTPSGVAVDGSGNIYIADYSNHRVRRVDAATGNISTVAGSGSAGFGGDGGPAISGQLYNPVDVALDVAGNLYISDQSNHRVRRVNAATGNISTVAGNGAAGYTGDNVAAVNTRIYNPYGVMLDAGGTLIIADYSNQRVRKVDAATGMITTVAGTGEGGYSGDGTPATGYRVRATASGFTGADAPVRVGQSRLYLHGLETSRNTLSPDNSFYVSAGDDSWLGSGQRLAQEVRVNIASSNPSVETVTTPLKIGNNQGYSVYHGDSAVRYSNAHVTGTGSTTISAGIDGSTPAAINGTSAGVTIVPATMSVNSGNTMTTLTGARNGAYYVYISGPAPAGGTNVTLTVGSSSVALLAPYNSATPGAASITLTIPAGSTSAMFDVIGVASGGSDGSIVGSTLVTATATGFTDASASLNVVQSTFYLYPPGSLTDPQNMTVYIGANGYSYGYRAAQNTSITMNSSNPAVLTAADVTMGDNASYVYSLVNPDGAGTATVTASAAGTGILPGTSGNITVNPVISRIEPPSGNRGSNITATVNGKNLATVSAVSVNGDGVSVALGAVAENTAQLFININALATVGPRTITLITPSGNVTATFYVKEAGPTPALIAAWHGEDNAADSIGGNNGTLENGTGFATGVIGRAFSFDGINDRISVPVGTGLSPSSITVAAWIKAKPTGNYQLVVDHSHGGIDSTGWVMQIRPDGIIEFGYGNGNASWTGSGASSSVIVTDDVWHHVAGTLDGSFVRIFVDGVPVSAAYAGTPLSNNRGVKIGGHWSLGRPFNGLIDEVLVYDAALPDTEIAGMAHPTP